jgi:hypothetical protein
MSYPFLVLKLTARQQRAIEKAGFQREVKRLSAKGQTTCVVAQVFGDRIHVGMISPERAAVVFKGVDKMIKWTEGEELLS